VGEWPLVLESWWRTLQTWKNSKNIKGYLAPQGCWKEKKGPVGTKERNKGTGTLEEPKWSLNESKSDTRSYSGDPPSLIVTRVDIMVFVPVSPRTALVCRPSSSCCSGWGW